MFRIRPALLQNNCRAPRAKAFRPWPQRRCASTRPRTRYHWTVDKLKADEQYPLSLQLSEKLKPELDHLYGAHTRQAYVRTQIVSPSLCDDVLKYIAPELEKHKGCDILDINPGAGLWSQKLHDFLQPRSHVLLEPTPEAFDDFLRPLLDKQYSKYRLVAGDTCAHETYRNLVNDGVFAHQKRADPQDPSTNQLNTTLLVTGSLMWEPNLPGVGFDSMSKQLFQQFAGMIRTNDCFHAFGPVRTLLWVPHDDFRQILPRSIFHAHKSGFMLDMLSNVAEVVTAGHTERGSGRTTIGREPQFEIESVIRAMKNGRERGVKLPHHRREYIHDFAEDVERMTKGTGVMRSVDIHRYLKEQENSGKSVIGLCSESCRESWRLDKAFEDNPGMFQKTKRDGKIELGREGKQISRKRAVATQALNIKQRFEKAADIGEEIYNLECKILDLKQDGPEKDTLLKQIEQLEEKMEEAITKIDRNYRTAAFSELDDRIALRSSVPRLQWDSRPFEPMVMQPAEAWPSQRCSLVLSTPRPLPTGENSDWFEWVIDFATGLFWSPSLSVDKALENMQPGASQITDNCPSLNDPKRGGRLNMSNFRVRMLTVKHVEELCRAYKEWPFRAPDANHNKYFRLKSGKQH